MRYAKLIDGALHYAPNPIRLNGEDIFTNNPTEYGYKPVVYLATPEQEGYDIVFDGWKETETDIRQQWRLEPIRESECNSDECEEKTC